MLHALAFNTLLSSQETDAYTVVPTRLGRRTRGGSFCFVLFFRCAVILSGPLFRVKPARCEAVDLILQVLLEFRRPRFRGNPSTLLQHPAGVQFVQTRPVCRVTRGFCGHSACPEHPAPGALICEENTNKTFYVTESTCQPSPGLARPKSHRKSKCATRRQAIRNRLWRRSRREGRGSLTPPWRRAP